MSLSSSSSSSSSAAFDAHDAGRALVARGEHDCVDAGDVGEVGELAESEYEEALLNRALCTKRSRFRFAGRSYCKLRGTTVIHLKLLLLFSIVTLPS